MDSIHPDMNERQVKFARDIERGLATQNAVLDEANKAWSRYVMDVSRTKVAMQWTNEGIPEGWLNVGQEAGLTDALARAGIKDMVMPAYIAKEFAGMTAPGQHFNILHREWRNFLQVWKEWATIRYPGFHVRNAMGGFFNHMIGGGDIADYSKFGRHLEQAVVDAKKAGGLIPESTYLRYRLDKLFPERAADLTWGELATYATNRGLGVANSRGLGDVRNMAEEAARELSGGLRQNLKWHPIERWDGYMQTAMAKTESLHRFAGFGAGLRATGGDPHGARMWVMMRHGDYTDLTDFEADVIKDIIPFYKWMRTNLPYQLRMLIENPAAQLSVVKSRNAAWAVQGYDLEEEKKKMPKWMRDSYSIPIPFMNKNNAENGQVNTMSLDLPMGDMQRGTEEFFSSLIPIAMPLIESYVIHKKVGTGAPLGPGEQTKLGGWASVPGIADVLKAVGIAKEGADGLYASKADANLINVIPLAARFKSFLFADEKQIKARMSGLVSMLAGSTLNTIDFGTESDATLSFFFDEVQPVIDMYKAMGATFPSKEDLANSPYLQKVPTQLGA